MKEFTLSLVRICNRPIIIARHVGKVETPAVLIITSQDLKQYYFIVRIDVTFSFQVKNIIPSDKKQYFPDLPQINTVFSSALYGV